MPVPVSQAGPTRQIKPFAWLTAWLGFASSDSPCNRATDWVSVTTSTTHSSDPTLAERMELEIRKSGKQSADPMTFVPAELNTVSQLATDLRQCM